MGIGFTSIFLAAAMLGPPAYTLAPIEAHVIDKHTEEPIVGALVIAHWVLDGPNGSRVGSLRLDEAITDEKGKFYFSGLGPVARPLKGVLDMQDPELIVFKSGYSPAVLANGMYSAPNDRLWISTRKSDWDKRRIPLRRAGDDEKFYALSLQLAFTGLARVFIERDCLWRSLPKAMAILDEENRRELAAGVVLPGVPSMARLKSMNCL